MAFSTMSTASGSSQSIARFGSYLRAIYNVEFAQGGELPQQDRLLRPEEIDFISHNIITADAAGPSTLAKWKPRMSLDYYYGIKEQLQSLVRIWDSLIKEKPRYDRAEPLRYDTSFVEFYLLALYIIPKRMKIAFLGPAMDERSVLSGAPPYLPSISEERVCNAEADNHLPEALALSDDNIPPPEVFYLSSDSSDSSDGESSEDTLSDASDEDFRPGNESQDEGNIADSLASHERVWELHFQRQQRVQSPQAHGGSHRE